jgi:hypothetical protein
MNKKVYRGMLTRDGTILVSKYRHDYVTYTDTVDGGFYMIDGGQEDYIRYSCPDLKPVWINVTIDKEGKYNEIRTETTK